MAANYDFIPIVNTDSKSTTGVSNLGNVSTMSFPSAHSRHSSLSPTKVHMEEVL